MNVSGKMKYLLPIVVSLILAFILLKDIDFDSFKDIKIDLFHLLQAFLVMGCSYLVRAYYYRITTRSCHLRLVDFWKVTAVYNFLSSIVPFSAGHYSYIYFLKKFFFVERVKSAGSLVVFHLFKGLLILGLAVFSLIFADIDFSINFDGVRNKFLSVCFFLILLAVLWLFLKKNGNVRISQKINEFLLRAQSEFRSYSSPSFLVKLFFLNVLNVVAALIYFWALVKALGFSIPLPHLVLLFSLVNFSALLPIHGYGRIGTHETLLVGLLVFLGYNKIFAVQLSFATHLMEIALQGTLGLVGYLGLHWGRRSACSSTTKPNQTDTFQNR